MEEIVYRMIPGYGCWQCCNEDSSEHLKEYIDRAESSKSARAKEIIKRVLTAAYSPNHPDHYSRIDRMVSDSIDTQGTKKQPPSELLM